MLVQTNELPCSEYVIVVENTIPHLFQSNAFRFSVKLLDFEMFILKNSRISLKGMDVPIHSFKAIWVSYKYKYKATANIQLA